MRERWPAVGAAALTHLPAGAAFFGGEVPVDERVAAAVLATPEVLELEDLAREHPALFAAALGAGPCAAEKALPALTRALGDRSSPTQPTPQIQLVAPLGEWTTTQGYVGIGHWRLLPVDIGNCFHMHILLLGTAAIQPVL